MHVEKPELADLAIGLVRGLVYSVTIALADGTTATITAGAYHTAIGDVSWSAIAADGGVVFYGEDAFKLADWICCVAWRGVTDSGDVTYDPSSGAAVVSMKVDASDGPIFDRRAEQAEEQRFAGFQRFRLPMLDMTLGFGLA